MITEPNEEKEYKASATVGSTIRGEIRADIEMNLLKFQDPIVLGELMYKLLEERQNTNKLLTEIRNRLDALGSSAPRAEVSEIKGQLEDMMLPEIDETIMQFVKESGKVTAEDVRSKFNYKGKNAASARLNRLFELNLLDKKQVGKKVFFLPK